MAPAATRDCTVEELDVLLAYIDQQHEQIKAQQSRR